MSKILCVVIGGSLGTLARYYVSGLAQEKLDGTFPFGTLIVNLIGCFIIGALMAMVRDYNLLRPETRSFWAIGFLGAFTTFSTFGFETSAFLHDGQWVRSWINIFANVGGGLAAVELGRLIGRLIVL